MQPTDRPSIVITAGSKGFIDSRGSPATDWVISELYAAKTEKAGGLALVVGALPKSETPSARLEALGQLMDGLIVTGGAFDIPPSLYNAKPHPKSGPFDAQRTSLELALIKQALSTDKPVLAICGGMQLLNVALGGTLIQDLSLLEAPLCHEQPNPRSEPGHGVSVTHNSLLHAITQSDELEVNSTHHQVIGELGSELRVSAIASDGVIEAIESTNHPFALGVQWHPEAMEAPEQTAIFEHFIQAAQKR